MMLKRVMGKASFATIQDTTGRIQLYVTRDLINSEKNPELYSQFKNWDGAYGLFSYQKLGQ